MPLFPTASSSSSMPSLTAPKSRAGAGRHYTLNQLIAAQEAAKREKDRSFLGKIFHGGKGATVFALRQILRPSLAVTTGLTRGLEGRGPFDLEDALEGARSGFMLRDHATGKDVLTELGWSKGGKLKSVAGFGVDVLTDPTLPLQIGATIATGGAAAPALLAGRAAIAGFAKAGTTAAARHKAAQEAVELLATQGDTFSQRKALAHLERGRLRRELEAPGSAMSELEVAELSYARAAAAAEEAANIKKVMQLQYNIPFAKGKKVNLSPAALGGTKVKAFGETVVEGGKRITPMTPSLLRTAKGGGVVGKVPGLPTVARGLGKTFKHGFDQEEWAKPLLMQAHMTEPLFDQYVRVANHKLGKHFNTLKPESQRHALSWAQRRTSLITRDRTGRGTLHAAELNGAVERGAINQAEADFIKDWHEYWEYQASRDKLFGVRYDKNLGNKLYVPHIYQRNGGLITSSDIAKAGFTKERVEDLTLEEMHAAAQSQIGRARNWISDPAQIMAIRTRRGAQAQSKEMLLRHMRRSAGMPARIPNVEKIAKLRAELKKQEARFAKNEWAFDTRKVGARKAKITNATKKNLDARRKKIDARIQGRYAALKEAFDKDLITEAQMVREAKDIERQHKAAYARAEKAVKREQNEAMEGLERKIGAAWREIEWADTKVRRINAVLERGPTKKNPHIPPGWEKLRRKIDGEHHHFSPELHEAMTRVEMAVRSEQEMENIVNAWDRAMAKWKIGVTSVNPGYRVRNTLSDVWNMYIAGVPAWAIPRYAARADRLQRDAEKIGRKLAENDGMIRLTAKEQKTLNTMREAHAHGILSGLFGGDVEMVSRMLAKGTGALPEAQRGHLIAAYARMMGNWNRRWEDKGRLTHYLYRREYEKMGVADSADWVKRAHFDYTELTPIEKEKFKKVMPFYTWSRKNIPYQLTQIAARPGKYATFPKAVNMFDDMATDEHGEMAQPGLLPDWMGERMAFRVPFFGENVMSMPLIGVTDLMKVDPGRGGGQIAKDWVGMMTPFLKVPIEVASGRSLFTGQEIDDGSRRPISGVAGKLLENIPGADVGPTSRQVRGETVSGEGANPWVGYLAGQVPMMNVLVNQQASINKAKRGEQSGLTILGYAGGLAMYDRDLEAEQTAALLENKEAVARVIRNLRRSGVVPPSDRERTAFERDVLLPALRGG